MEEPSINKLHEQSILLREGRDWGLFHPSENQKFPEGGERPADGGQETTSSFREEGKVCKLTDSFTSERKKKKIFLKKPRQENFPLALINFPAALTPYLIIIGSVIPKKWWRIKNWTRGTADMR